MKPRDNYSIQQRDVVLVTQTETLWTVVDLANYLHLKHETVRNLAWTHKLPALKVEKAWRFHPSEILGLGCIK